MAHLAKILQDLKKMRIDPIVINCSICKEPIKHSFMQYQGCGHNVHMGCITNSGLCKPLCDACIVIERPITEEAI